jgi:hypothetical protein
MVCIQSKQTVSEIVKQYRKAHDASIAAQLTHNTRVTTDVFRVYTNSSASKLYGRSRSNNALKSAGTYDTTAAAEVGSISHS